MKNQGYTGELKEKRCPLCDKVKPVKMFGSYYSKSRGKYRIQNYCKDCEKPEKNRRSAEYYERNKEKVKAYARSYRRNPKYIPRRKKLEARFKVKYRQELKDCYVADAIAQKIGVSATEVRKVPGLIEVERTRIQLIRKIRSKNNEKQTGRSKKPPVHRAGKAKR